MYLYGTSSMHMPVTGNTYSGAYCFLYCVHGSDSTGESCFVFDAAMKALCTLAIYVAANMPK